MTNTVAGKRIAVTGAASGIGLGIAAHLVAEGARVALLDRDADAVAAAAASLGESALAVVADVTDESSVADGFAAAGAWAGGLEGAVACAGVQLFGQDAAIHELDLAVYDRTAAVNARGAVLTGKYAARALIAAGGGSIVMIGSPTGIIGQARGFTAYSSTKAAVHGLARVMAADLAPHDIRVNIVVPGFTRTPLVQSIFDEGGEPYEQLLGKIPMGRAGTPADVGHMTAYLLSDANTYSTGGYFMVDGGMLAV